MKYTRQIWEFNQGHFDSVILFSSYYLLLFTKHLILSPQFSIKLAGNRKCIMGGVTGHTEQLHVVNIKRKYMYF